MSLIEALIEKAKLNPKRVALPECEADKTLLAARRVLDEGIGVPVLVNDPAVIKETAARVGVSLEGMEIVDTTDETVRDGIIARYVAGMMLGEGASHAWVEVLHDGIWTGYDPTNDLIVSDGHIKLSHGRDAWDCAINRGIFLGSANQTTEISVIVAEGH